MAAQLANLVIFLSLLIPLARCHLIDCFVDNEECEIHGDNLIQTFMGVTLLDKCSQLCEDNSNCTTFTFFGTDGHPLNETCLLFSTCATRRSCQSCVTGLRQDSCACSVKFDGNISADNFVDIVPDVPDELTCMRNCSGNNNCGIYTFYDQHDQVNPNVCFLLKSEASGGLRRPVIPCKNCCRGPVNE